MWVLEGHVTILGTELGPGFYVHIRSGVEHDIDASATDGCTVFYLYLRRAEYARDATPAGIPTDVRSARGTDRPRQRTPVAGEGR